MRRSLVAFVLILVWWVGVSQASWFKTSEEEQRRVLALVRQFWTEHPALDLTARFILNNTPEEAVAKLGVDKMMGVRYGLAWTQFAPMVTKIVQEWRAQKLDPGDLADAEETLLEAYQKTVDEAWTCATVICQAVTQGDEEAIRKAMAPAAAFLGEGDAILQKYAWALRSGRNPCTIDAAEDAGKVVHRILEPKWSRVTDDGEPIAPDTDKVKDLLQREYKVDSCDYVAQQAITRSDRYVFLPAEWEDVGHFTIEKERYRVCVIRGAIVPPGSTSPRTTWRWRTMVGFVKCPKDGNGDCSVSLYYNVRQGAAVIFFDVFGYNPGFLMEW